MTNKKNAASSKNARSEEARSEEARSETPRLSFGSLSAQDIEHDPSAFLAAFGKALRDARESADLTQTQLAKRSGFHGSYISKIERGNYSVNLAGFVRLALGLEGSPELLLRRIQRILELESELEGALEDTSDA